jgi:RHS repeat-associated protein
MSVTWPLGTRNGIKAYTGREWDPETGLYYYRARYYDPKVGRFISEDPIGFAGGPNLYAYVGSDPANAVDPFGLIDCRVVFGVPVCSGAEEYPGEKDVALAHEYGHHLLGVTFGVIPGWRDEQLAFEAEANVLEAKIKACPSGSPYRGAMEDQLRRARQFISDDFVAKNYWNMNNPWRAVPLPPLTPRPSPSPRR